MTVLSTPSNTYRTRQECPVAPAPWLRTLLGLSPAHLEQVSLATVDTEIATSASDDALLVSVKVPGARGLPPEAFIETVGAAYDEVRERFAGWTPARFWNHIPWIHEPVGEGLDRYMAFNLGRRAGLRRWLGAGAGFASRIATATGIGHRGDDLVIHGLGWRGEVAHVENPRQRPAYRYSRRYGPASPSFARATWLGARECSTWNILAIGGTASIRGEDTIAPHDLRAQVEETLTNLSALIAAAGVAEKGRELDALSEARVYHVCPEDEPALRKALAPVFSNATRLDFHRADICRGELLIEIEGIVVAGAHR